MRIRTVVPKSKKYLQVVAVNIIPQIAGKKWAPKIVLLLDDQAHVLNVNRGMAGKAFESVSEVGQKSVHSQLHPKCDGKCVFKSKWTKAWASMGNSESIEWEVDDPETGRVLRLNLSRPPTLKNDERDRRRQNLLLTITDITKFRREYESLVERQQALIELLMSQGIAGPDLEDSGFDKAGDTGNRLMAVHAKEHHSFGHKLILAQEEERKRIATELHDGITQTIGVLKYQIEGAASRLAEENPDLDLSVFDDVVEEFRSLVDEIRRVSSNFVPSVLEDFGVGVAVEWLCREFTNHHPDVHVHCKTSCDEAETPDLVKITIYRVVQEALNNVNKHASATRVDVSLEATDDVLNLTIVDNGTGLDLQEAQCWSAGQAGLGLRSMRERVEATGGTFVIESPPGKGVVLRAEWAEADLALIR